MTVQKVGSYSTQLDDEPKRLRQKLEESEARFRDVIERNADAIVVVDHEGVIRFANPAAAELFSKPREELLGTSFGFPVVAGETTELDLPHKGAVRVVEMRVVESHWQGQPACIASLRDVTERKHAEDSERQLIMEQVKRNTAEEALRRMRFLADASVALSATLSYEAAMARLVELCVQEIGDWAVVYCTTKDGQLRRYEVAHRDPAMKSLVDQFRDSPLILRPSNPIEKAMQTGQPVFRKKLTDADLAEMLPDEDHRAFVNKLGLASLMMLPIAARGRSLGAVGLMSASPDRLFDDQDLALAENLAARAGMAIDNARLYEQAREADQTKTELLAVISHDLRTPLNSIIGYAQLLEMGIPEAVSESTLERINRMRQSAGHLLYLIDELLAFARVEGHHEEVKHESFDVCRIVREVGELMEPLVATKGLELRVEIPAEEISIVSDADKLRQILVNLVGNAVKYTQAGSVTVGVAEVDDQQVTFCVQDTGVGIETDQLPHIFEPFWQADRGQRTAGGGTGLGLSVVQRVVQLLAGTVRVESEPGRGSRFYVSVPRVIEAESA